jgi:DNA-binding GntR family transcriptional regulator
VHDFACACDAGLVQKPAVTPASASMSAAATSWGTYARIADTLRARLAELSPGSPLPSETALAGEFGVVRNTVRRAMARLADEGLVETVPGRGRVVRSVGQRTAHATYRRIAADMEHAIKSGALAPGAPLPSEAALTAKYGVSRGTARQALSLVESLGLVRTVHGKGRFVQTSPEDSS